MNGESGATRSKWRFWAWPWELRRRGVLGMNGRNATYILPGNPREHYPRVDDKLLTKLVCEREGIAVPQTYAVVERQGEVRRWADLISGRDDFVIKPAQGSGGRGITVVTARRAGLFVTAGGETLTPADVQYHLSAVLAGMYSLGGRPDRAIIEQRIVRHRAFERIAVGGTPDLRVVVYRGVPAMAMVRLPTHGSRGRANLHQGAAAAGIDLRYGRTVGGVCRSRQIDRHPDTKAPIAGLIVPDWDHVLAAAVRLAHGLELGYVGIDFVLDEARGPLVLEANARPGLGIQLANRCGLIERLRVIDSLLQTSLGGLRILRPGCRQLC
jgi:alpha-L-glutamate ligase-like protein